jgi:TctA family transporter
MGLYAAKLFARISLIPTAILWPIVFALSVIGAYALSASLLDVWIALIFGVVGFFARRHGFSVAPIAVGLILGHMVEVNLQNSLKMFDGAWWMILTQPLALLFLVLAFLGLFGSQIVKLITRKGTRILTDRTLPTVWPIRARPSGQIRWFCRRSRFKSKPSPGASLIVSQPSAGSG